MAQGRLSKFVGAAQSQPVLGILSLVSLGVFVSGVALGIVKAVSHLGLVYMLIIAVPLGVLAVCVTLLSLLAAARPNRTENASEPFVIELAQASPSAVGTTGPNSITLVVDDLSAYIKWNSDDPRDWRITASCRIHISNRSGHGIRVLKAHLVAADTYGMIMPSIGEWDYYGIFISDGGYETVQCNFDDPPSNALTGADDYEDAIEITDDAAQIHSVLVKFRAINRELEKVVDDFS